MNRRFITFAVLLVSIVFVGQACATKKYVRKTLDERIAPLEGRTTELEESARRTTAAIKELDDRLSGRITAVDNKAQRATDLATEADRKAVDAKNAAIKVGNDLDDTKGRIDDWSVTKQVAVYFKTNKFDLTPEAKAELDAFASAVKPKKGYRVVFEGYADRRGGVRHNEVLTENRAKAVERYLVNTHKLDVFRLKYIGAGKIDDGARGKDALQQNRRVDVRLLENTVVNKASRG
jgi:outer membrane protein OmpA-like peptidoglycan-associated protein